MLMEQMEYTAGPMPTCEACKSMQYSDDLGYVCTLNPACHLHVQAFGRCRFFTLKTPKQCQPTVLK